MGTSGLWRPNRLRTSLFTASAVIFLLYLMLLVMISDVSAAPVPPYYINATDGGDCTMIGTWDVAAKTCTLNQDVSLASEGSGSVPALIVVQDNDITIEGAGHTLSGINHTGTGIEDFNSSGLKVMNLRMQDFYYGINLYVSPGATVQDNVFFNNLYGAYMDNGSGSGFVVKNEFTSNVNSDLQLQNSTNIYIYLNDFFTSGNIFLSNADNNIIFNNNFLDPTATSLITASGTDSTGNSFNFSTFGGNYWETHSRESQGCANADNDGFCDSAYLYSTTPILINDFAPLAWRRSFFSWYDSASPGAQNWVLMSNPDDPYHVDVWYELFIENVMKTIPIVSGKSEGEVPTFKVVTPKYDGLIGGPVEVDYRGRALASQRTLWAGNSLEEVMATDASRLSSHYYWTWYDQVSSGFKNWVLISNPNSSSVYYRVKIGGAVVASTNGKPETGSLLPGASVEPQFDGTINGPVEVEAWFDSVGGSSPANIIASQRVLLSGDTAFNEVPGIPAGELTDDYVWSWYDDVGGQNWILLANPNGVPVNYAIEVGSGGCVSSPPPNTECQVGVLQATGSPGSIVTPRFGIANGPVRVSTSGANIIASQRVTWGPSFEEVPGYPTSAISSDYYWTWYDQQSPGMTNWIVVASPPDSISVAAYYIKIGGVDKLPTITDFVYPGDIKSYTFPGEMGGPVEVLADNDVIVTQRVLYNGYFNEVMGTVLP